MIPYRSIEKINFIEKYSYGTGKSKGVHKHATKIYFDKQNIEIEKLSSITLGIEDNCITLFGTKNLQDYIMSTVPNSSLIYEIEYEREKNMIVEYIKNR